MIISTTLVIGKKALMDGTVDAPEIVRHYAIGDRSRQTCKANAASVLPDYRSRIYVYLQGFLAIATFPFSTQSTAAIVL
jgi:hypothetical protein